MLKIQFIALSFLFSSVCLGSGKVSVNYGGDENGDACPSLAQVANLGEGKDEFLAVKIAPNLKALRVDKLHKGQQIWICEEQKDWYGVVYTSDSKQDCGISASIKKRKPYLGPCKSGWVNKKYTEVLAD